MGILNADAIHRLCLCDHDSMRLLVGAVGIEHSGQTLSLADSASAKSKLTSTLPGYGFARLSYFSMAFG